MEITRTSPISGKTITKDLPITEEQYVRWQNGDLIQEVMPDLPADDREFLITGITGEEWANLFKKSQ